MPFINDPNFVPNEINQFEVPENAPEPTLGQTFESAFRQENSLYSFIANGGQFNTTPQPVDGYDPFEDVNEISGYEQFASSFSSSMSPDETAMIKKQIDREIEDRAVLDQGGFSSFAAQVAAGTLDPVYLPFMVTPAGLGVRGASAFKTGVSMAVAGGFGETAAEYAKHQSQLTRTIDESITNIAGATLLTGIAGATLKGVDNALFANTSSKIEYNLHAEEGAEELEFNGGQTFGKGSVGAAQVKGIESEYLNIEGTKLGIEKLPVSPIIRTMTSPVTETKLVIQRMMETPVITKGEKAGIATMPEGGAAETRIKSYEYILYSGMNSLQDHYLKYRQTNKIGAVFETMTGRRGSKMSRAEFNEAVAKAMRRNDESDIPEVSDAAKEIRKKVFDPIKEKAIEEGLLDDDLVKWADSYLTRMYNFEKIVQNRHQWDSIIKDWLKKDAVKAAEEKGKILELKQTEGRPFDEISEEYFVTTDKAKRAELRSEMQIAARREGKTDYEPYFSAKSDIEALEAKVADAKANEKSLNAQISKAKDSQKLKELAEQLQDWKKDRISLQEQLKRSKSSFNQIKKARIQDQSIGTRISGGQDDVLQSVANSITDKILGGAGGRLDYDISPTVKGPLKERTLAIRDEIIEDFLVSDIESIMSQYVRTMAPDIELKRMFGSLDLKQEVDAVRVEYDKLRKDAKTPADLKKLDSRMRADIRDIEAMRDRLRGTYRMPEDPNSAIFRMGQFLMGWNFVRMLGGMTLSAIPDTGRIIARNGFGGTARVIKNLTNFKQFGLAKTEARKAGIGLEMVLNSRSATLNDLTDIYAGGTKAEKGLRVMTDTFGKVSLMTLWNDALKIFSGVMAQDRFIGDAIKLADGTLSKSKAARLAAVGIDKDQAIDIVEQFRKHGTDGDLRIGNVDNWDDDIAKDVFKMALLKDVDATIMTPGAGVKPLWTSGPVGKLIFQFKTFAAEAHHKILISDLQYRDASAASNLLIMSALGVMTYAFKQYGRGQEIETDPAKLVIEGLDNSGVLGYFWDVNNTIEKASRGTIGVSPLVGESTMSRYASRSAVSALLGPSLGTASDAVLASGAIASGEMSESDVRTMRKLLPYQNLFYVRRLLDEIEKPVAEAVAK